MNTEGYPQEEKDLEILRELLLVEEDLPPGLASRVEAALVRERNRCRFVSWTEVLAIFCTVTLILGRVGGIGTELTDVWLLAGACGAYSVGIRWISREMCSVPETIPKEK